MAVQEYKPIYSVKETAKLLQVSVNTVYGLLNSGEIPYLSLGAKKIRGSDLEAFIQSHPREEMEVMTLEKVNRYLWLFNRLVSLQRDSGARWTPEIEREKQRIRAEMKRIRPEIDALRREKGGI